MAKLDEVFDATQVQPSTGSRQAIPAGFYNMTISESEFTPNKTNSHMMLLMTFKVLDGPMAGSAVRNWLSLKHPNQQPREIARGEFSAICHATGILSVGDTSQLHNIPVEAKVIIEPYKGKWSNKIEGVFPRGTNQFDPLVVGTLPDSPQDKGGDISPPGGNGGAASLAPPSQPPAGPLGRANPDPNRHRPQGPADQHQPPVSAYQQQAAQNQPLPQNMPPAYNGGGNNGGWNAPGN